VGDDPHRTARRLLLIGGCGSASDAVALDTYKQLLERWQDEGVVDAIHARMRGEVTDYDPTPPIARYVAGLLRHWPDIGKTDVAEESPWADAPLINNATGPLIYFSMVYSKANEAVSFASELAAAHGLNCFDPQSEKLLTPPAPSTVASGQRWRRRS
jgi:hypothetical protein